MFALYQSELTGRELEDVLERNASMFTRSLAYATHDRAEELRGVRLRDLLLVRERSRYGYAKASWEINLGCDYDCEFCYLGEKSTAMSSC